jgi:hypothetical protein
MINQTFDFIRRPTAERGKGIFYQGANYGAVLFAALIIDHRCPSQGDGGVVSRKRSAEKKGSDGRRGQMEDVASGRGCLPAPEFYGFGTSAPYKWKGHHHQSHMLLSLGFLIEFYIKNKESSRYLSVSDGCLWRYF